MSTDETTVETPAVVDPEPEASVPATRAHGWRHRRAAPDTGYARRFAAIYLVLALFAGVAVGVLVVLVARPDTAPDPVWSTWQPTGSETAMSRQIADRVARTYRLENGEQLVVALGGPPTVTTSDEESSSNIRVSAIAIRPDTSTGAAEEDDIEIVESEGSHQFVLCGLGQACSISYGVPSTERHSLLRREALELALYTFRYVESVESVTVFLPPPPPGSESTQANVVFIRRGDIDSELRMPLRHTLDPTTPSIGRMHPGDLASVNRLTLPHLYTFGYTQAQDGSAILILDPIGSSD